MAMKASNSLLVYFYVAYFGLKTPLYPYHIIMPFLSKNNRLRLLH
jgi:hypothetical protein